MSCSLEEKPLAVLHLVTSSPSNLGEGERENRVLCFTNSRESTHRSVMAVMFRSREKDDVGIVLDENQLTT